MGTLLRKILSSAYRSFDSGSPIQNQHKYQFRFNVMQEHYIENLIRSINRLELWNIMNFSVQSVNKIINE